MFWAAISLYFMVKKIRRINMAKVRLIDTKDKFLLEIDGTEIPHVSTYEISKSVLGYLTMKIVLSVNEIEELDIETDKTVNVTR